MINLENLARLRDAIITGDGHQEVGFNLFDWVDFSDNIVKDQSNRGCLTTACLGGWCRILQENTVPNVGSQFGSSYLKSTSDFLGIDYEEAENLCYASHTHKYKRIITVEETLKVLDHLRDTGKVDWSIINEEVSA